MFDSIPRCSDNSGRKEVQTYNHEVGAGNDNIMVPLKDR